MSDLQKKPNKPKLSDKFNWATIGKWGVGAAVLIALFNVLKPEPGPGALNPADIENIPASDFQTLITSGGIRDNTTVNLKNEDGHLVYEGWLAHTSPSGKPAFRSNAIPQKVTDDLALMEKQKEIDIQNDKKGFSYDAPPSEGRSLAMEMFISWFPMAVLITVWIIFMKRANPGGMGGQTAFGKSKAKMLEEDVVNVTFADVAGCDEAKEEVVEMVDFLKYPQKYQKLGGKIPRGALMVGPPGTGKTLLARAIAGEAKVPFFTISGSDFVEMFVGVGASRVRDMFEKAKAEAPCILFIDEIDAVGRQRGVGLGGGNDEREQTLNQLLVEMDGFEGNEGVIVIAATNRADVLDKALLRPGRFDRQITVGLPDIKGREQILNVHLKKVPTTDDVNPANIARGTPGFSGADLANLVNEGALGAARSNKRDVSMSDLEKAKDKILMGTERPSMMMSEEEKERTAMHEAGHCIVGRKSPGHDPVYKVSIMPRGRALGITMFLPERDHYSASKQKLESQIASLTGGRIAEEILSSMKGMGRDDITTGASNDIERATELARNMVTKWDMGETRRFRTLGADDGEAFAGYTPRSGGSVSGETAASIDKEMQAILDRNYERAEKILTENNSILLEMTKALMKYETIDTNQIRQLMEGAPADKISEPEGYDDVQAIVANNDNNPDDVVVLDKGKKSAFLPRGFMR